MTEDIEHMLEQREKLTNNLRILDEAIVTHARLHLEAEEPEVQKVYFERSEHEDDFVVISVNDGDYTAENETALDCVLVELIKIKRSLNNAIRKDTVWKRDDVGRLTDVPQVVFRGSFV